MPLFGNDKFNPKPPPERKATINGRPVSLYDHSGPKHFATDLGLEIGRTVSLNLGDLQARFQDGQWKTDKGGKGDSASTYNADLKRVNKRLHEENNSLKLKIELLLDMLTEITAECHLQEDELKKLTAGTLKNGKWEKGH